MKPFSAVNNASDDGILIQKIVKRGLVGLSFAIIVLSSAAFWTVVQLTDFYQNKVIVIEEQENLLHVMRVAARERTLLMYAMVNEEDIFKNEDNRLAFYTAGSKFIEARTKFSEFILEDNEVELLKKHDALTRINSPIHERVVNLVFDNERKLALKLLREQVIPTQNNVMRILDEIHASIGKRSIIVKTEGGSITKVSILILIVIVAVLILGSMYIIRKTTSQTFNLIAQLNKTREFLQTTIHELIQQKDTLDNHAIVSIADRQGKITYVNDKFCDVSGYNREELIGKNHRMLKSDVHEDNFYKELWDTISHGKVWQGEICNRRKNGTYYWVESTINPFLDDKGIPYQYVSVRTDITHLLEAKYQAEKASRSKSIFLSSMSHELRTPLNAILGFAQLIKIKNKDELTNEYNDEILQSGSHLLALINDVLDLAKVESGKIELSINSYSLKDILNFCLVMVKSSADKRLIQVENKVDSLSDVKIDIDEKRFKQVLLNLLSNAIKYNKEKGRLTIDYALENDDMVYLSITDTGKGIAVDQQSNIFQPFDRAGEEGSAISGTGLGLVITKKLIEKMKGSIGFTSTEHEGSCFWIKVPLSKDIG